MSNMMQKKNKQSGFTFVELVIAMGMIIILVAVVILATQGFFDKAQGTAMKGDIHTVENAVDDYMLESVRAPTGNGGLPLPGEYALIDFNATFTKEGSTYTFYPSFLAKLPRHWDEGVWRINSAGLVSVDLAPDEY